MRSRVSRELSRLPTVSSVVMVAVVDSWCLVETTQATLRESSEKVSDQCDIIT